MNYGYGEDAEERYFASKAAQGNMPGIGVCLNQAVAVKGADRALADANAIRDQLGELSKAADSILERLIGSGPCNDAMCAEKQAYSGGFFGEITRVQSSSIDWIDDLRRTLESISRQV